MLAKHQIQKIIIISDSQITLRRVNKLIKHQRSMKENVKSRQLHHAFAKEEIIRKTMNKEWEVAKDFLASYAEMTNRGVILEFKFQASHRMI